jgi:hypothetical protein
VGIRRLARIPAGEFGRHRLAHDDAAGNTRMGHAYRVDRRAVAPAGTRTVGGRHVGGVADVLDAHGNAVEQPSGLPVPGGAVARARLAEGEAGIEILPGRDVRFALLDAAKA